MHINNMLYFDAIGHWRLSVNKGIIIISFPPLQTPFPSHSRSIQSSSALLNSILSKTSFGAWDIITCYKLSDFFCGGGWSFYHGIAVSEIDGMSIKDSIRCGRESSQMPRPVAIQLRSKKLR